MHAWKRLPQSSPVMEIVLGTKAPSLLLSLSSNRSARAGDHTGEFFKNGKDFDLPPVFRTI
jgi:hypothetical protein